MKWVLVITLFGSIGLLVAVAARRRDGWISSALRRDGAKLDNPEIDEQFAHEIVPADQDARDKGAV